MKNKAVELLVKSVVNLEKLMSLEIIKKYYDNGLYRFDIEIGYQNSFEVVSLKIDSKPINNSEEYIKFDVNSLECLLTRQYINTDYYFDNIKLNEDEKCFQYDECTRNSKIVESHKLFLSTKLIKEYTI